VGLLKSTNLQFSRCYIFVSFENNVEIVVRYNNSPFWISADANKDVLECLFHLNVRLVDGMLDLRMLWISELTVHD